MGLRNQVFYENMSLLPRDEAPLEESKSDRELAAKLREWRGLMRLPNQQEKLDRAELIKRAAVARNHEKNGTVTG